MHPIRPMHLIRQVLSDRTGATALEYGFFVAFVSAVLISGAVALAGSIDGMYTYVASQVTAKVAAAAP